MEAKICTKCKIEKSLTEYHKKGNSLCSWCKNCRNKHSINYRNSSSRKSIDEQYRLNNKAKHKKYVDAWYLSNQERLKEDRMTNRDKYEDIELRSKYGISLEEKRAMIVAQNNLCAICRKAPSGARGNKWLHVDHNHKTGKVRELLCHSCNMGIGSLKEDILTLEAAIKYLVKHNGDDNG